MKKALFTDDEFEKVKSAAEVFYKEIGEARCPYLNTAVAFNALGLDHIKMKSWEHARSRSDQFMRLKLLKLAPEVLKKSHSLQGLEEGKRFERVKAHSRWEKRMTHVRYFEFIAILKGCRVRVIVKQIDNAQPYFWSIVPYWRQGSHRRRMFEGDAETD